VAGRQQAQLEEHREARSFRRLPGLRASSAVQSGNRSSEDLNEQRDDVTGQVACSCWVLETRRQTNALSAVNVGRGRKPAS